MSDQTAANVVAEQCKAGTDEDSCGNVEGCAWSAGRSACGPKCESLGAGPCKDPAFGCEWTPENKCAAKGTGGDARPTGCPAYTTTSTCNAGSGCGWDTDDNVCYATCDAKSSQTDCGTLRGKDGAQRCLWANNKCSRRVVAQCSPLWEDNSETVGVVAGSGKMEMNPGQVIVIIFVAIATAIVFGIAAIEQLPAARAALGLARPAMSGGGRRRRG
jgi:hypothetical protein